MPSHTDDQELVGKVRTIVRVVQYNVLGEQNIALDLHIAANLPMSLRIDRSKWTKNHFMYGAFCWSKI